ncbi:MAG: MFS transporter [Chloroflexi bacterium]|nr:MFS transporter [Chloroflexota bacterium]
MDTFIRRHLRWNLAVNIIEGAFFWIGSAFYSFQTVLPLFVSKLTDNPYALGWLATVGNSGWLLPQLFTAQWVKRTPVKRDIVIKVGFFSERLPVLVLALIAWFVVPRSPRMALWLTLFTATWLAYGSGLIAIAWQSMVAKVIPQEMRGRFLGTASALGMAGGALAASLVTYILNTYAFPGNFARSFALGALAGFLSWFFLSLTREPPDPVPDEEATSPLWREIPRVLRRDPHFTRYLIARMFIVAGNMGTGFLAVYAVERWHLSDGHAGVFNGVSMGAQFIAYLLLGTLADKRGHTLVLKIGALSTAVSFLVAAITPIPLLVYVAFAGLGTALAAYIVSGMMIVPEFAPQEELPLYFGLSSTLPGVISMLSPMLAATVTKLWGYRAMFALSATLAFIAALLFHTWVTDPRRLGRTTGELSR